MPSPRRIVLVAFPGCQSLDVAGPLEVFSIAARPDPRRYTTEVVGPSAGPLRTNSGLTLVPDTALGACRGRIDTLVVAGGSGVREAVVDERLVAWVAAAARRSRRVASVCTGAFLLAAAGLLEGCRATTHWEAADLLAEVHPGVRVEPDRIYVRDGDVWTSAGVTAGIDLALALVEDDHGREAALAVARQLVVFARRPGGQSQFSEPLAAQHADRAPLRATQERVRADPVAGWTVEAMAEEAGMSVRHFARAFAADCGVTPAAWVEGVRVQRARELLEASPLPVDAVARAAGFGTDGTVRRAVHGQVGDSPREYRDRFRAAVEAA